jgi:hypothetical protein
MQCLLKQEIFSACVVNFFKKEIFMDDSSGGAWLVFLGIFGIMCVAYPPMIGLGLGVGAFCVGWFLIYKMIGG